MGSWSKTVVLEELLNLDPLLTIKAICSVFPPASYRRQQWAPFFILALNILHPKPLRNPKECLYYPTVALRSPEESWKSSIVARRNPKKPQESSSPTDLLSIWIASEAVFHFGCSHTPDQNQSAMAENITDQDAQTTPLQP